MNFTFSFLFFLAVLPTGSIIEDLLTLASQAIEPTTDESMQDTGTSLLCEHQKLMLQHFGSTKTAILLDHIIQHMLLWVCISYLTIPSLSLIPKFCFLLRTYDNVSFLVYKDIRAGTQHGDSCDLSQTGCTPPFQPSSGWVCLWGSSLFV